MQLVTLLLLLSVSSENMGKAESISRPPENVYRGDLVAFPGPWSFDLGRAGIILVSDE